MASVRKCDICGKVYDHYPKTDETILLISAISKNASLGSVYSEKETDCCPECTMRILRFIELLQYYPNQIRITIDEEV